MSGRCFRRTIPWLLLGVFVSGCTPLWYGVFVNATQSRIEISLTKLGNGQVVNKFGIEPRSSFKTEIGILIATVTDEGGNKLFEQRVNLIDPEHRFSKLEERLVYFLITEKGIYRIPREYRKNWQDHIGSIMNEDGRRSE